MRSVQGATSGARSERCETNTPESSSRELVNMIKACIRELQKTGSVEEFGWSEHVLRKPPFADSNHIEFHTYDDNVLVVFFRREERRVIRMVGVYDHASLPNS